MVKIICVWLSLSDSNYKWWKVNVSVPVETLRWQAVCWCGSAGASGLRACLSVLLVMSRAIGHAAVLWARAARETKAAAARVILCEEDVWKKVQVSDTASTSQCGVPKTQSVAASCSPSSCRYSCWAEADGHSYNVPGRFHRFTDDTVFKSRKSDTCRKCSSECVILQFVMECMLCHMISQETWNAGVDFRLLFW